RLASGQSPLQLDSTPPKTPLTEFVKNETRFRMVERQDPARFRELIAASQHYAARQLALYQELAKGLGGAGGNGAKKEE
ncbi:MAG TPA: hypothetical protein VNL70_02045, partial [Tepidisphaeraceae bacterium]|nr:hypothetical protein [Tepidisphaeraceae bacterium]